jgi:pyruvate kinase
MRKIKSKKTDTYFFKKAVKIPIYSGYFIMIFSNDGEKIRKVVKCNPLAYIYAYTFHNFIYNKYESFCVVFNFWDTTKITLGTIMHEITHAGNRILKARDIGADQEDDEAEAYLKGFLGDCVENFMLECKIT